MTRFRTILLAHDFSPHAQAALDRATELVALTGARLHLVHCVVEPILAYPASVGGMAPVPSYGAELMAETRRAAETSLMEIAGRLDFNCECHVVPGAPATAICETARKLSADLIVMGTHGRTGIAHVFLGSVAERTLRQAPCPVLVVPATETESVEDVASLEPAVANS
jgi:nucleotide-binding universal stress UspA family protein